MEPKPIIIPTGFQSSSVDLSGNLSCKAPRKVRGLDHKKPKPAGTQKDPDRQKSGGNEK